MTRQKPSWLGGVCIGLAAKLGVDPLLLRGLLIVLLIVATPVAVLGYAVAWLLLPDEHGRIIAEHNTDRAGQHGWLPIALLGLAVFALLQLVDSGRSLLLFNEWMPGATWFSWALHLLWQLLLLGGLGWLIYWSVRHKGNAKGAPYTPTDTVGTDSTGSTGSTNSTDSTDSTQSPEGAGTGHPASAAHPGGTAHPETGGGFGWHASAAGQAGAPGYGSYQSATKQHTERVIAERLARPKHASVGGVGILIALGFIVLLSCAVGFAASLLVSQDLIIPITTTAALGLTGLILVGVGWRGYRSGLLSFLSALLLVASIASTTTGSLWFWERQQVVSSVVSSSDGSTVYTYRFSDSSVDLRSLAPESKTSTSPRNRLSDERSKPPADAPSKRVIVESRFSDLNIILPANATVLLDIRGTISTVDLRAAASNTSMASGWFTSRYLLSDGEVVADPEPDAAADIVITLNAFASNIELSTQN